MAFVLLALFIVVPIAELFVIVQVADGLGIWTTLVLLLAVSLAGAWLVKREGTGALERIRTQLAGGELPTDGLVDGGLILLAGALMLTPGFLTDTVGLLLCIPLTRRPARAVLVRRFRRSIERGLGGSGSGSGFGAGFGTWSSSTGTGRVDVGEAVIVADSSEVGPTSRTSPDDPR